MDLRTLPAAQRAAENAVPLVCKAEKAVRVGEGEKGLKRANPFWCLHFRLP